MHTMNLERPHQWRLQSFGNDEQSIYICIWRMGVAADGEPSVVHRTMRFNAATDFEDAMNALDEGNLRIA